MKAILPAAGYGTRMNDITKGEFSKILLEIQGRPIIEHCLEKILEIEDVDGVLIVSNDKFYGSFMKWKEGYQCREGVEIVIYNDGTNNNNERLGTIGDIELALSKGQVEDDFLVVNPDNLFPEWSLVDAYERFREMGKTLIGIMEAESYEEVKKKGHPRLDERDRVIAFREKPENPESRLSSNGIYFFPREIIQRVRDYIDSGNNPDKSGEFIQWLVEKDREFGNEDEVYGHFFEGRLYDIGSVESYREAQRFLEGGKEE